MENKAVRPPAVAMTPVMSVLFRVTDWIDSVSEWSWKAFGWLILPLVGGLCYEVFLRYVLRSPTTWVFDTTYMLYGSYFMLGTAYALKEHEHIRTDMLYTKFSPRTQGLIDAVGYLVFFFPSIGFFVVAGWQHAVYSLSIL